MRSAGRNAAVANGAADPVKLRGPEDQMHVALLGDSIFDNASYVGDGIDVIGHLRSHLGPEAGATLLAVDGSRIEGLLTQARDLQPDCTHMVVSAGGNNALDHLGILNRKPATVGAPWLLSGRRPGPSP